jgi:nucleoid DNA-binding protein
MNFQRYAEELAEKFIRNHEESERIIKFLFKRIAQDLIENKRINFRGFGSFKKVYRPARRYYDINKKKFQIRPAFNDIEFSPSKQLLINLKSMKRRARSPRP